MEALSNERLEWVRSVGYGDVVDELLGLRRMILEQETAALIESAGDGMTTGELTERSEAQWSAIRNLTNGLARLNDRLKIVEDKTEWLGPGSPGSDGQTPTTAEVNKSGHVFYKCPPGCDRPYCQFCEGGLSHCTICLGFEGSLPRECPGAKMTTEQANDVYAGTINFFNGKWWRTER